MGICKNVFIHCGSSVQPEDRTRWSWFCYFTNSRCLFTWQQGRITVYIVTNCIMNNARHCFFCTTEKWFYCRLDSDAVWTFWFLRCHCSDFGEEWPVRTGSDCGRNKAFRVQFIFHSGHLQVHLSILINSHFTRKPLQRKVGAFS